MTSDLLDRKSNRLRGHDYAQAGAYAVTVVTRDRQHVLGSMVESAAEVHGTGRLVVEAWTSLLERFPHIMLDAFFVMPNHIHGIVFLGAVPEEDSTSVGTSFMASAPHNRKGARWEAGPSG